MEFLRRKYLTIMLLALLLTLTAGCSRKARIEYEVTETTSPWPYYRGDLASTGARPDGLFSGKLDVVWKYYSNDKPAGPLTIHHGRLAYPGGKNKIRFIELAEGKVSGTIKPKGQVETGLVAVERLVLFAVGPANNFLKCYNVETGKKMWQRFLPDATSGLLVIDDCVIAGTKGGDLMSLKPTDGDVIWHYRGKSRFSAPPTYFEGVIYQVADDGCLYGIDAQRGTQLFKTEFGGSVASAVAVAEFVFAADVHGYVYALDKSDGHTVWRQKLDGPVWTSAAVSDGVIVLAHSGGEIAALNAGSGNLLWKYPTVDVTRSSAVIAGDYVVAGTLKGKLYSLNLADGSVVDSVDLKGAITAAPVSDGDRIYVATDRGVIACLGNAFPEDTTTD